MQHTESGLPAPVRQLLSRLPAYPGSLLFAAGLNLALARHLPLDVLALLEGRKLRIHANDTGVSLDFMWDGKRFVAQQPTDTVALTITASSRDFLLMMQRKEDPDTLFFSRRLTMEGDTELGLLVKNTLDAIDPSVLACSTLLPASAHPSEVLTATGKMIGLLLGGAVRRYPAAGER